MFYATYRNWFCICICNYKYEYAILILLAMKWFGNSIEVNLLTKTLFVSILSL